MTTFAEIANIFTNAATEMTVLKTENAKLKAEIQQILKNFDALEERHMDVVRQNENLQKRLETFEKLQDILKDVKNMYIVNTEEKPQEDVHKEVEKPPKGSDPRLKAFCSCGRYHVFTKEGRFTLIKHSAGGALLRHADGHTSFLVQGQQYGKIWGYGNDEKFVSMTSMTSLKEFFQNGWVRVIED